MEATMKIRFIHWVLMIGAILAVAAPSGRSLAQSSGATESTPKNVSPNVGTRKHPLWRHRGGKHPHFGSRRVRT
jgi:hypothetical protein